MKKSKKIVLSIIITIALLFSIATYIVGSMVYEGTAGSKPEVSKENMIKHYSGREDKVLDKLEKYKYEKLFVSSPENGYDIEVMNIKSNKYTKDVMVLVHGIESNYHEVLNSAFNYLDRGHNVVVYNQRQTGYTGGEHFTFGLYERFDLDEVVKYASRSYPDGRVGVHGYSMGAATATMHSELNERDKNVDFYILDGPYHTMGSAIEIGIIGEDIPLIPVEYAAWAGNLHISVMAGFGYKDVEPHKAVENISVPVMLIHGKEDKVTSPESSEIIYNAIPHNNKELWLIDGLAHCKADDEIPEEYFNRIYGFIEKYN